MFCGKCGTSVNEPRVYIASKGLMSMSRVIKFGLGGPVDRFYIGRLRNTHYEQKAAWRSGILPQKRTFCENWCILRNVVLLNRNKSIQINAIIMTVNHRVLVSVYTKMRGRPRGGSLPPGPLPPRPPSLCPSVNELIDSD